MPKQIVLTALGNRIEYATTNSNGLITGKRKDITDDAINAVFEHMMREFNARKIKEPMRDNFSYTYPGYGTITYSPIDK